jgi:hypothetical protein
MVVADDVMGGEPNQRGNYESELVDLSDSHAMVERNVANPG